MSGRTELRAERASLTQREGFALPMVLLALALITAAVVAAYSSTSAEVVANSGMRAQDHAYQLAEAGLEQFLLRRGESGFCGNCVSDPAASDPEWTTVSLTGGYATVVATRIRPKVSDAVPALFFVRSTGVDTMVKQSGSGYAVHATRTVGQYATFGTASLQPLGAWTSLNGLTNSETGNKVPVLGADECTTSSIAGVVVPKGKQYTGSGKSGPSGSPGLDSTMTLDSLRTRVGVDWNGIVNYHAIAADIEYPAASFPTKNQFNNPNYYPVIHVTTSFSLPYNGQGLLIVDSNLTIASNEGWDGIILVGGTLSQTGQGVTTGIVLSGLNRILPGAVNPVDGTSSDNDAVGNTRRVQYNSCKVSTAASKLKTYFAWTNTWLDNVAVW